ncbi:hypothetical protein F-LCD7_0406 [Faustovirus]|nr:hypothetical protein F-LCD7_0406 [Faustovirus]
MSAQSTTLCVKINGNANPINLRVDEFKAYDTVFKYQLSAMYGLAAQSGMYMNVVISDGLNNDAVASESISRNGILFQDGDKLTIRTGRFTLNITIIGDHDTPLRGRDLIITYLRAIVTAYVDERWRQGVNKAESELLGELQASVHEDQTYKKLHTEFLKKLNDARVTYTAPPKAESDAATKVEPKTTFTLHECKFELLQLRKRATRLDRGWQFAIITGPSRCNTGAMTIHWDTGIITQHEYIVNFTLKNSDIIRVEVDEIVVEICCHGTYEIPKLTEWVRSSLLNFMSVALSTTHKIYSQSMPEFALIRAYNAQQVKAFVEHQKCTDRNEKAKLATQGAKSPKPVSYLCGLARQEQVCGIKTIRFGTVIRKCVLGFHMPTGVNIKNMDVGKFEAVKVVRIMRGTATGAEISKVNATFNISDDGVLRASFSGSFIECYITYDGEVINAKPFEIDFEFDNSKNTIIKTQHDSTQKSHSACHA